MTWWLLQNSRLKAEKAALVELEGSVDWLSTGTWQTNSDLEMCIDFLVAHGDEIFELRMRYPSIYPDMPPMIFTKDNSRISNHQYGASGELCLEHRPDNWHPSVTGADMVLSCHRLIVEERPAGDENVHARSAHAASLGRDLRSKSYRFMMSEMDVEALKALPEHHAFEFSLSERKAASSYLACATRIGPQDDPIWVSDLVLPQGFAEETGSAVRVPGTGKCGAITAEELSAVLIAANHGDLKSRLIDTDAFTHLLMGDGENWELFSIFGKTDDRKVFPYKTIVVPADRQRLPAGYEDLANKKVGIVGCGSVGSKVAASLCRAGVGSFLLVDEDIFFPGNVVRNELDLKFTGAHKAYGLRERLTHLAPKVDVKALRTSLGGQESGEFMAGTLEALGSCDVVIDATASPTAFNLIASIVTRQRKPMVWSEVFAGGIGGFVARARPNIDPIPLFGRRQIEEWCVDQGVDWIRPKDSAPYDDQSDDGTPLVADDADVSVIAAHTTRMVIDLLVRPEESIFPVSAYAIGLSSQWLFEQPFDTRAIDLIPQGEWGETVEAMDADAMIEILKEHLPPKEDADATSVAE